MSLFKREQKPTDTFRLSDKFRSERPELAKTFPDPIMRESLQERGLNVRTALITRMIEPVDAPETPPPTPAQIARKIVSDAPDSREAARKLMEYAKFPLHHTQTPDEQNWFNVLHPVLAAFPRETAALAAGLEALRPINPEPECEIVFELLGLGIPLDLESAKILSVAWKTGLLVHVRARFLEQLHAAGPDCKCEEVHSLLDALSHGRCPSLAGRAREIMRKVFFAD